MRHAAHTVHAVSASDSCWVYFFVVCVYVQLTLHLVFVAARLVVQCCRHVHATEMLVSTTACNRTIPGLHSGDCANMAAT